MKIKKRLAVFCTHPIQYYVPWFRGLQDAGVDITVFYGMMPNSKQQGDGFGVEFEWDIPLLNGYSWKSLENVSRKPSVSNFYGIRAKGIRQILSGKRFDVVVITGWNSLYLVQALFAAKTLGLPVIMRGESNILKKRNAFQKIFQRMLFNFVDRFLYIGENNKELYLSYGIEESRLNRAPYFIDSRFLRESVEGFVKTDIRNSLKLSESTVVFLFVGKFITKKRPMDFVQAIARLVNSKVDVHGLMVGDGELRSDLQSIIDKQNLPILITGFKNQSQLGKYYMAADCFVLPSDAGETWGLVVNEAMSFALPAIVSDEVGCTKDLVLEGVTGSIYRCGDVEGLSLKMTKLAHDKEALARMGMVAADKINKEYVPSVTVSATKAALESL